MKTFIALFSPKFSPVKWWRIFEPTTSGLWACVATDINDQKLVTRPHAPRMHEDDGDFTDEAESLEEFIEKHIEVFL